MSHLQPGLLITPHPLSDVQREVLRPLMDTLMGDYSMYPGDHIYNEAAFLASGATDFVSFRTNQMPLWLKLTQLVCCPTQNAKSVSHHIVWTAVTEFVPSVVHFRQCKKVPISQSTSSNTVGVLRSSQSAVLSLVWPASFARA